MKRPYKKSSNYQSGLQEYEVSIPAVMSEDNMHVVLSDGVTWVCVSKEGKKSKYFVKVDKLKPEHKEVEVGEGFGVMENTRTHVPIRCRLESLAKLIKNRGGRHGQ